MEVYLRMEFVHIHFHGINLISKLKYVHKNFHCCEYGHCNYVHVTLADCYVEHIPMVMRLMMYL